MEELAKSNLRSQIQLVKECSNLCKKDKDILIKLIKISFQKQKYSIFYSYNGFFSYISRIYVHDNYESKDIEVFFHLLENNDDPDYSLILSSLILNFKKTSSSNKSFEEHITWKHFFDCSLIEHTTWEHFNVFSIKKENIFKNKKENKSNLTMFLDLD